jgi:hypothetical protein
MAKNNNVGTEPVEPARPVDPSVTPVTPTPPVEPEEPVEPQGTETEEELKTKQAELEDQLQEVRQKIREKQSDVSSMEVGTVVTIQLGVGSSRVFTKQGVNSWTSVRITGDGSVRVTTVDDRDVNRLVIEEGRRPQVVRPEEQ